MVMCPSMFCCHARINDVQILDYLADCPGILAGDLEIINMPTNSHLLPSGYLVCNVQIAWVQLETYLSKSSTSLSWNINAVFRKLYRLL